MNAQRDELDSWLDEALAEYQAPEPRPGLELRTLAYVRSQPRARQFGWRKWVLAMAAVLLIALSLAVRSYRSASPQLPPVAQKAPPRTSPAAIAAQHVPSSPRTVAAQAGAQHTAGKPEVPRTATAAIAPEPRLATFPSALPLTTEERMLLTVTRRSPDTILELARNQGPIAPVVVDEIKIQPLEERNQSLTGEKK